MFKSIIQQIFLYLLLLIVIVAGTAWCLIKGHYVWGVLCTFAVAGLVYVIMRSYRRFNGRLNYMLVSLQNEDHTFRFPENLKGKNEKIFNSTLNRIRDLLQKARQTSIEQERYYELILHDVKTGIIAIDDRGHVYQHNRAALHLLNLDVFTHVNQLRKVNPDLPGIFSQLKAGDRRKVSYTNERDTVQLIMNVSEITFNNRMLRIIAINDIDSELGEKEMESWIRLIRVLTHEIMNSIAPITSLSETLLEYQRRENPSPETMEAIANGLEVIHETGKSLISFVESYRKFTGIRQPEKTFFNVYACINRVVQLMQMEPDYEQVNIDVQVVPDDLQVFADEKQITQVIVNLLKNALQAVGHKKDGYVHILAGKNEAGNIFIAIHDNGKGIPPELADNIFVPFFTTKEKGSGIGLSVSRYIMRLHNGQLYLRPGISKETVFTMIF